MKKTLIAMMAACFFNTYMVAQTNECIRIKVTNIPATTGKVLLLTDKGQQGMADAKEKETIIEMEKLPIGKYKFNVIHDANNNWKLDMDKNNIPIESCASVEVDIKEDSKVIVIELQNFKNKK